MVDGFFYVPILTVLAVDCDSKRFLHSEHSMANRSFYVLVGGVPSSTYGLLLALGTVVVTEFVSVTPSRPRKEKPSHKGIFQPSDGECDLKSLTLSLLEAPYQICPGSCRRIPEKRVPNGWRRNPIS